MEEHVNYAVDFIESTRWIKAESARRPRLRRQSANISFSFRGNNPYARSHARRRFSTTPSARDIDMGIVNAGMLAVYEEIEPQT